MKVFMVSIPFLFFPGDETLRTQGISWYKTRERVPLKRIIFTVMCVLWIAVFPEPKPAAADTLMSLYRCALQHFPSLQSFAYKEQSLRNERAGLGWQRVLDMDVVTNYYHLSTEDLGKYFNGDVGIFNTFDIFNKKGLDREITGYEIQKNKSYSDAEKKTIFSNITEAYFALLLHTRLSTIHEENLAWIEKNILLVNKGVEYGVFPITDINRWTIERLNCRNSLLADTLDIARAEETLRILTGLATVSADDIPAQENVTVTVDDLIAHSPELNVYEIEKKQAMLDIRKEIRSRFPDLQVGNSLLKINEPESTGDQYVVSANLSFKLFDGGRGYRIAADQARIKSIERDGESARALLTATYRTRVREMNTQKEMMENLRTARDLSGENLEKLSAGYQKRFVDFTTLFNAFREDMAIRENYVNAYIGYHQSCQFLLHLSQGDIYF